MSPLWHTSSLCPQRGAEQRRDHLPKPDAREATPALRGAQGRSAGSRGHGGVAGTAPSGGTEGPTSRGPEQPAPRVRRTRTAPRPREKRRRRIQSYSGARPSLRAAARKRGPGGGGRARWKGGSARPHRAEEVAADANENEEAADPAALREGPARSGRTPARPGTPEPPA